MASLGLTQHFYSLSRLFMDPQSVSTFKPTRYNVAYPLTSASPNVVLIGMKRGEVLMTVLKRYRDTINVVRKLTTCIVHNHASRLLSSKDAPILFH